MENAVIRCSACPINCRSCWRNKSSKRYSNADLKICQYLSLHMKIICRRFHIKTPFTFWDMRTWDMWKVCLQTFKTDRIRWNLAYFLLRNLQTSRANNSRIFRINKAKISGYCFYMNTGIQRDFQICISVPLIHQIDIFYQLKRFERSLLWKFSSNYSHVR